jgi:hypothetical protein
LCGNAAGGRHFAEDIVLRFEREFDMAAREIIRPSGALPRPGYATVSGNAFDPPRRAKVALELVGRDGESAVVARAANGGMAFGDRMARVEVFVELDDNFVCRKFAVALPHNGRAGKRRGAIVAANLQAAPGHFDRQFVGAIRRRHFKFDGVLHVNHRRLRAVDHSYAAAMSLRKRKIDCGGRGGLARLPVEGEVARFHLHGFRRRGVRSGGVRRCDGILNVDRQFPFALDAAGLLVVAAFPRVNIVVAVSFAAVHGDPNVLE